MIPRIIAYRRTSARSFPLPGPALRSNAYCVCTLPVARRSLAQNPPYQDAKQAHPPERACLRSDTRRASGITRGQNHSRLTLRVYHGKVNAAYSNHQLVRCPVILALG
jgi:hypothetical protein